MHNKLFSVLCSQEHLHLAWFIHCEIESKAKNSFRIVLLWISVIFSSTSLCFLVWKSLDLRKNLSFAGFQMILNALVL